MTQKHIGKTCPYCQFPLKADSEAVACPSCKVPHHRECWEENSGCTTFGCGGTTFRPEAGERVEISFDEAPGQQMAPARGGGNNKLLIGLLVMMTLGFFIVLFAYINLHGDRTAVVDDPAASSGENEAEETPQTFNADVIAGLEADYYIDYENGAISIGDLPIGAKVVDPTWQWEHRLGVNYSDKYWKGPKPAGEHGYEYWATKAHYGSTPEGEVKPVIWLVVAKDHYDLDERHVTLLAKELVGLFTFDDSTDRGREDGHNHWGKSGTTNANSGLRPWLNSVGIHSDKGFFQVFSDSFKNALLATSLPNKEWENGSTYNTTDNVFIPSTTELADSENAYSYQIGSAYPYFEGMGRAQRVAKLGGENKWYWTRSPGSMYSRSVRRVIIHVPDKEGEFGNIPASFVIGGVRPALNLKSEVIVSEIKH